MDTRLTITLALKTCIIIILKAIEANLNDKQTI